MQIKKGDKVKVITGSNKGQEGIVMATNAITNKVIIEGVNMGNQRSRDPRTGKTTVSQVAKSLDASNVKKI